MRRRSAIVFVVLAYLVIGFCLVQCARLIRFHIQDRGASLIDARDLPATVVNVVMVVALPFLPLTGAYWVWKTFRAMWAEATEAPEPLWVDDPPPDGWCPHCGLELLPPGARQCPECGESVG